MPIFSDLATRGLPMAASFLAVFRDQRHADLFRLGHPRAADGGVLAVHPQPAAHPAHDAEEGQQQLLLALAVEPADADDLAPADRQRNVVQALAPGQVLDLQAGRGRFGRRRLGRKDLGVGPPDHELDDLVVALGAFRERLHVPAVAKHRADVGELFDLVHAMGDVENGQVLVAQLAEDLVDLVHVRRGQRRGGLVQDQQLGIAAERLGDLDHLAARQGQVLDQLARMQVGATDPGQQVLGPAPLGAPVDETEAAGRRGDADVVGHRQVRQEGEFLEHADHAAARGVLGGRVDDSAAFQIELPGARLDHSGDDLDQGRLAGAVLAQHRSSRPAPHGSPPARRRSRRRRARSRRRNACSRPPCARRA
jgi:hypothetical protein